MSALDPYMGAIKLGGIAIISGLLIYLALDYRHRGREIERLEEWQEGVISSVTKAAGTKDRIPASDVATVIDTLAENKAECDRTLLAIDESTTAAKDDSDAADRGLESELRQAQQKYRAALTKIADLEKRQPVSGTCAEKLDTITGDSEAAWKGWQQ